MRWRVPERMRLWRVVFDIALKTSFRKLYCTGKSGESMREEFGRDTRTRTPEACAPHSTLNFGFDSALRALGCHRRDAEDCDRDVRAPLLDWNRGGRV